ncbi:MAG: twin-arginine translocation signal domain-containing protein, partial [Alphaproteobacteria bacterium]
MNWSRRQFLAAAAAITTMGATGMPGAAEASKGGIRMSEQDWREKLTPEQYHVLREEGTERAFTSPLNEEKRAGTYHCAGCGQPLFSSSAKFDSGTGWPSFFEALPGSVETKTDFKLVLPEYHCSNCGGHQGHVFK